MCSVGAQSGGAQTKFMKARHAAGSCQMSLCRCLVASDDVIIKRHLRCPSSTTTLCLSQYLCVVCVVVVNAIPSTSVIRSSVSSLSLCFTTSPSRTFATCRTRKHLQAREVDLRRYLIVEPAYLELVLTVSSVGYNRSASSYLEDIYERCGSKFLLHQRHSTNAGLTVFVVARCFALEE